MKKLLALFTVLVVTFAGIWIYKMKNPEAMPEEINSVSVEGNYWWNSMAAAEAEVSTNWRLAEGVPANYIPVPGKTELYMVVDNEGYIIGYKQRAKNETTGDWEWTEVNPDIPENYEPVPGLKDVYRVTAEDGSVKYFKYIRNKDDTYAFVEVDAKGNMFGVEKPKGSEVPENYERVNRNQYAVKDNNGVTIAFMERVVNPSSESGFDWVQIDENEVGTTTADALPGFDLNMDITGEGSDTGGNRPYYGNTSGISSGGEYSVMPTLMPQQVVTASTTTTGTFTFTNPVGQTTITEQVYVTAPPMQGVGTTTQEIVITTEQVTGLQDNTKHELDPIGSVTRSSELPVQTGLQDNTKHELENVTGNNGNTGNAGNAGNTGNNNIADGYIISAGNENAGGLPDWQLGQLIGNSGNTNANGGTVISVIAPDGTVITQAYEDIVNGYEQTSIPVITDSNTGMSGSWVVSNGNAGNPELSGGVTVSNEKTGTISSTESSIERVQEGNDIVTYQKTEIVKYDLQGNELSRNVTDRKEISRESAGGQVGNATDINKSGLNAEYDRVTGLLSSNGGRFNGGVPNDVVSALNADRSASGKMPLTFDGNASMYKIALCRACMMAFTGTDSKELQGYGSLGNMCKIYGVNASSPSENALVTNSISASAIHSVFQNNSYDARMSDNYSKIVVAIVEYGGKYYIDEIIFN